MPYKNYFIANYAEDDYEVLTDDLMSFVDGGFKSLQEAKDYIDALENQ
jgi:hypothetical protein